MVAIAVGIVGVLGETLAALALSDAPVCPLCTIIMPGEQDSLSKRSRSHRQLTLAMAKNDCLRLCYKSVDGPDASTWAWNPHPPQTDTDYHSLPSINLIECDGP